MQRFITSIKLPEPVNRASKTAKSKSIGEINIIIIITSDIPIPPADSLEAGVAKTGIEMLNSRIRTNESEIKNLIMRLSFTKSPRFIFL